MGLGGQQQRCRWWWWCSNPSPLNPINRVVGGDGRRCWATAVAAVEVVAAVDVVAAVEVVA